MRMGYPFGSSHYTPVTGQEFAACSYGSNLGAGATPREDVEQIASSFTATGKAEALSSEAEFTMLSNPFAGR
jgi:hypothetical protein